MASIPHRAGRIAAMSVTAILAILTARPAGAFAGYEAHYSVASAGFGIGSASLVLEPTDDGAALAFTLETDPLLGLVEPSVTRLRASMRRAGRGYMPDFYTSLFRKRDRTREIDATFGEDGRLATFELRKRGRKRVERVPEGLDPDVLDPLTAMVRARAWLDDAPEGGSLPLKVFDGRKRYEAELRYLGPVQTGATGEDRAAHRVALRYRVRAELDEDAGVWLQADDAAERSLDLLISADGRYLPLRLAGSLAGVPLTAVLATDCPAPPGCAAN